MTLIIIFLNFTASFDRWDFILVRAWRFSRLHIAGHIKRFNPGNLPHCFLLHERNSDLPFETRKKSRGRKSLTVA